MHLLFLHGAGLTGAMWRPQLDDLADEFEVSAIDLPGHGSRSSERFDFHGAIAAVEDAVIPGSPTILVGLSLGGYVAVAAVAEHPSLVTGLVLSGCSIDFSSKGNRALARRGARVLQLWPKGHQTRMQSKALRKAYPTWAEEMIAAGYHWRGYVDSLRAAPEIEWHERLRSYDRPVLVLDGERDTRALRESDHFLKGIGDVRAEVIQGAGHLSNLDKPDEYTAAVRAFAHSLDGHPHTPA
jgi:pimeloyl-ACP methyl ester carboxylesterase